jgi:hypothetical protein
LPAKGLSVRARNGTLAFGVAFSVAVFGVSAHAAAASKRIAGKLSKPGYTVVALADDGEVSTATERRFRLEPPARRVTLHLQAADGTYAGPIVVGKHGKSGIVGVEAGAKLGTVKVKAARGFAKPKRKPDENRVDPERTARARNGVPIGAGNFGHVRAKEAAGRVAGDTDLDGIPEPLDVDDDGDLTLDPIDTSPRGSGGRQSLQSPSEFRITPMLPAITTANSHIGSDDAAIEQNLPMWGRLHVEPLPGGPVELDCSGERNPSPPPPWSGGLVYCTPGGTGRIFPTGGVPFDQAPEFPECCDADGDGYGEITGFQINHFARSDQIFTGNEMYQHVAIGGDITKCPPPDGQIIPGCKKYTSTLPFVFATSPALTAYRPEDGAEVAVTYPLPSEAPGGPSEGFTVSDGADPDQNVEVLLTFYRPQRRPTSESECVQRQAGCTQTEEIDIGGLGYAVGVSDPPGPSTAGGQQCPQGAFSELSPELRPEPLSGFGGGVADTAADQNSAVTPADTLSFTLDITQCLGSTPWQSGESLGLDFFAAHDSPDQGQGASAQQGGVRFKLP